MISTVTITGGENSKNYIGKNSLPEIKIINLIPENCHWFSYNKVKNGKCNHLLNNRTAEKKEECIKKKLQKKYRKISLIILIYMSF